MTTLYGIKNCDTVKKARRWLDDNKVDYRFHDFRIDGLDEAQIRQWLDALGWETLINKRSTTWKGLDESTKNSLNNDSAVAVIATAPTLIKRPLLDKDGKLSTGFKADHYTALFKK